MASSKDMQPLGTPFFPHIFYKNQFQTKPVWAPTGTNLTGKCALVTGANQGLGLEASDQLLSLKLSHLIIAVRSTAKGEAAAKSLRAKYPKAIIDVYDLDMCSYDSIQALVARVELLKHLDIAILNAGVRQNKFELVTSTGHEVTYQVNYLSTVLLCIRLLPVLKQKCTTSPGRITIIGSGLSFASKWSNRSTKPLLPSFDDPSKFDASDRYNVSKLLCSMFLRKLADLVSADDVVVNIVDPGFVTGTNLTHDLPIVISQLFKTFRYIAARPLDVGASTYIDAAVVKGKESHGSYIMSWKINP